MPTKKQRYLWIVRGLAALVTCLCMWLFVPWAWLLMSLTPLSGDIQEQLDLGIESGLDGVIVFIDKAGEPPLLYSAGWQNRQRQQPMDPRALFKIGSISKLYMAVAATKLIAAGQLQSHASLSHYLPDLAPRIAHSDAISVKMLIQHRSGIPDWIDDPDFPWQTSLPTPDAYLALVLDEPGHFVPDSQYDYSNTNYVLLARILDKVLGYSHKIYIREQILAPLGLSQTYAHLEQVKQVAPSLNTLASGYYVGFGEDVKHLNIAAPGGDMIATAQDVGVFLRALNQGGLLLPTETPLYTDLYPFEHTGEWVGYSSIARFHPDIDTTIVLFANTSGGHTWLLVNQLYARMLKILQRG